MRMTDDDAIIFDVYTLYTTYTFSPKLFPKLSVLIITLVVQLYFIFMLAKMGLLKQQLEVNSAI